GLCNTLRTAGHPVHLETSGTLFQEVDADLICISPKLRNSTPDEILYPEWHVRHETSRLRPGVLRQFMERWPVETHLKFVVNSDEEIREAREIVDEIHFQDKSRVFLMPQARNLQELTEKAPEVVAWALREGFRYSDRLQLRLWDGEHGR
ncbi:MAG TPA: hypothetical protein VLM37_11110, partial [Fibrobacteraceae bacterium]|nr:hypothetical protein [Fibrobacteraceae bacterium]